MALRQMLPFVHSLSIRGSRGLGASIPALLSKSLTSHVAEAGVPTIKRWRPLHTLTSLAVHGLRPTDATMTEELRKLLQQDQWKKAIVEATVASKLHAQLPVEELCVLFDKISGSAFDPSIKAAVSKLVDGMLFPQGLGAARAPALTAEQVDSVLRVLAHCKLSSKCLHIFEHACRGGSYRPSKAGLLAVIEAVGHRARVEAAEASEAPALIYARAREMLSDPAFAAAASASASAASAPAAGGVGALGAPLSSAALPPVSLPEPWSHSKARKIYLSCMQLLQAAGVPLDGEVARALVQLLLGAPRAGLQFRRSHEASSSSSSSSEAGRGTSSPSSSSSSSSSAAPGTSSSSSSSSSSLVSADMLVDEAMRLASSLSERDLQFSGLLPDLMRLCLQQDMLMMHTTGAEGGSFHSSSSSVPLRSRAMELLVTMQARKVQLPSSCFNLLLESLAGRVSLGMPAKVVGGSGGRAAGAGAVAPLSVPGGLPLFFSCGGVDTYLQMMQNAGVRPDGDTAVALLKVFLYSPKQQGQQGQGQKSGGKKVEVDGSAVAFLSAITGNGSSAGNAAAASAASPAGPFFPLPLTQRALGLLSFHLLKEEAPLAELQRAVALAQHIPRHPSAPVPRWLRRLSAYLAERTAAAAEGRK